VGNAKKKINHPAIQGQKRKKSAKGHKKVAGVMMNNYFPALVGGAEGLYQNAAGKADPRYPKFSNQNLSNQAVMQNNPNMVV
jgi:hypothetical protein